MDSQQSSLSEEKAPVESKGVQFRSKSSIEEVKRISRISNYDLDEVTAYWGDGNEQRVRKEELKVAVKEWQQGRRSSDNFTFTTRGIADKVGEGKAAKKANRTISRMAVMDEQELQEAEGLRDDELLAQVYSIEAIGAKEKARKEALDIANEVERFNVEE